MAGKRLKKKTDEHFIKTFDLTKFRIFHPRFKECLTGTERALLDYIIIKKLTYTGKGHAYGGNTIRIDKQFKEKLLKEFNVSVKTYEGLITKLVQDGVFNRISNGFFQVNPYVYAKGEDITSLRDLGIYRENTVILKDKKNVCAHVPSEEPWEEPSESEDEGGNTPFPEPRPDRNTPLPSFKRKTDSIINSFF